MTRVALDHWVTGNLGHLEGGVGEEEVYKGADHADFEGGQDVDARRVPQARVTTQSCYRKAKYGGMDVSEVKRLKELGREKEELKKIVAEQALYIRMSIRKKF